MKAMNLSTAAMLACSLSLGGCCITLDLGGPGSELQWMGIITSGTVSRQIDSWDDFRELDHTSVALVVAIVDEIPPEAWDPESEWPGPMQWVLLRPQQPADSTDDQDGDNTGDFITDVSWRIDASLETQISLQSTDDAIAAMLELIDSSDIEYVWIAPGFGPLLMPRGDEVQIGMNLPIEPAEAEASQEPSVYDTVMTQRAYTQFAWINVLTLNIASNDALRERLEPVREHSYVFRIKPTR